MKFSSAMNRYFNVPMKTVLRQNLRGISIREKIVTSTTVYLGKDGNILEEQPENCKNLKINNPILTNTDLLKIKMAQVQGVKCLRSVPYKEQEEERLLLAK